VQLFLLVVVEADPRVLARGGLDVLGLDLLDQLEAAGGLRALDLLAEKRRTNSCRSAMRSLALVLAADLALARLRGGLHVVVVVAG
jgi:hypothetical protein